MLSSLKAVTFFDKSKHDCIKIFSKNCLYFTKNINIIQIPEIARQKLWNFFQQKHFYSEAPSCYNDSTCYFCYFTGNGCEEYWVSDWGQSGPCLGTEEDQRREPRHSGYIRLRQARAEGLSCWPSGAISGLAGEARSDTRGSGPQSSRALLISA